MIYAAERDAAAYEDDARHVLRAAATPRLICLLIRRRQRIACHFHADFRRRRRACSLHAACYDAACRYAIKHSAADTPVYAAIASASRFAPRYIIYAGIRSRYAKIDTRVLSCHMLPAY